MYLNSTKIKISCIFFTSIFFLITSCNKEKKINNIDENLKTVIHNYIKDYPILPKHKWRKCYPSYNVHFDTFEKDTIMAIVLLPGIDHFFKYNNRVNGYKYKKEDGYYPFDKQSPVVFFNTKLFTKNLSSEIIEKIPDTITDEYFKSKKSFINVAPPFNSEVLKLYFVKDNKFILINQNDSLYKKIVINYNLNNPRIADDSDNFSPN
jgi:hypothetical protein